MNIIDTSKKCVGCGACTDACHVKALQLKQNTNGFYEPLFVSGSCINCGKCIQVCPALNIHEREVTPDFYYGWCNDAEVRQQSSSGGVFSVLAEQIIAEGGTVFGAKYSDDCKSVRMSSTDECTLDSLRRSKYCQSYSDQMYKKIEKCLKNGKKVMVVGTPCQIAAARQTFKYHNNLLLVDFLCGGVMPQTAFSNYISYMENKYHSKVKSVNMRSKERGWSRASIRIEFENGKVYSSRYQFDYYYYYYYCTPYMKNEPCLTCSFTKHPDSDITIGDFWGYKNAGVVKDDKGISFVCAYTDKGKIALDSIKETFVFHAIDAKLAQYAYSDKKHSEKKLEERERFMKSIENTSFVETAKKNYFKFGKNGVLIKILLRKVVRK